MTDSQDECEDIAEFVRTHPDLLARAQLWVDIQDQPPLMTAKEVATFLRLDQPSVVLSMLRSGELTGMKPARHWLVPRGVVAEFVLSQMNATSSDDEEV